jgi:methionyl-tRNA formyltransferase
MLIALLGRSQMLYQAGLMALEEGHQIGLIVTAKAAPEYSKTEHDFASLADKLGCPFYCVVSARDASWHTAAEGLDIALSVNFPFVIDEVAIKCFKHGILNAHAGDLPRYRGNAVANWAILNNEMSITLSVHLMQGGKLDCGPILAQAVMKMTENTRIGEVYQWQETTIPQTFAQALQCIDKQAKPIKTTLPSEGFRCYPRLPQDGLINWELPARSIHNLIRASGPPFAGAYTYQLVNGAVKKLIILSSRVITDTDEETRCEHGHIMGYSNGSALVRCGAGVIAIDRCRYESEDESFEPASKWRSIRMRLGVNPLDWLWLIYSKKSPE